MNEVKTVRKQEQLLMWRAAQHFLQVFPSLVEAIQNSCESLGHSQYPSGIKEMS